MENPARTLVPGNPAPACQRPDELDFRCSSCGGPIAVGEGRYRFTTQVYHVRCWEAGADDPTADPTGRLSERQDL